MFVRSFKRFLSLEERSKFDSIIKSNPVVVFMKGNIQQPMCGFSKAVVQILQVNGVDHFETINVLSNDQVRNGIKEYSNWPTIPQVYIKGEFMGGCDIILDMHKTGKLEALLIEKGIIKPQSEE